MKARRAAFWLLAVPAALMAVVGAFLLGGVPDPFRGFESEAVSRTPLTKAGQAEVVRNVHADVLRLAVLKGLKDYEVGASANHDALVFRSREPNAAIPMITLRHGRRFEIPTPPSGVPFGPPEGKDSRGWTIVEMRVRPGLVAGGWDRLQEWMHPKPPMMARVELTDGARDYRAEIVGYLARERFR